MVDKITKTSVQQNKPKKTAAEPASTKKTTTTKNVFPAFNNNLSTTGTPFDFASNAATLGGLLNGEKKGQQPVKYPPKMKALLDAVHKSTEEVNKKRAKMTPEQRAKYDKEQAALLLEETKKMREKDKPSILKDVKAVAKGVAQGIKEDYKDVHTVRQAVDKTIERTRDGFARFDKAIGLTKGTTEKVWAAAATVATGYALAPVAGAVLTSGSAAIGATGAAALTMASCSEDGLIDVEHNMYVELPTDTVFKEITLPADTVEVIKNDTIWNDKIIEKIVHDTIQVPVPGPVIEVPEKWKSEVPPKQKEILDKVGIKFDKNGEFVLSMNYYDEYNQSLTMKMLNGQKSTRDGQKLVFDEIRTGWGDDDQLKLGKNETYARYEYSLSADKKNLNIRQLLPKQNEQMTNNNNQPNWNIFKYQLNDEKNWKHNGFVTLKVNDNGEITMSGEGEYGNYILKKGDIENSVTIQNPYGAKWRLSDVKVKTGDAQ